MPSAVTPIIAGGNLGVQLVSPSVSGNVITQAFSQGVAQPPSASPVIVGIFAGHADVYPTSISATYAGLPATAIWVEQNPSATSTNRPLIVVQCLPGPSDTYSGADFVVTLNGSSSFFVQGAVGFVATGVDPGTTLADAVSTNAGVVSPFSITNPPISALEFDMIASAVVIQEAVGGGPYASTSAPAITVDNSLVFTGGVGYCMGYRVCVANETNAVEWEKTGTTLSDQDAQTVVIRLRASLPQVPVPDIVGLSQSDATDAIIAAQLVPGNITELNSPTVPAGFVMLQGIAPGTLVSQGSNLDYTISLGAAVYIVPNVVGDSNSDALAAIAAAGLVTSGVTVVYNQFVPAGQVLTQSPPPGTSVPALYPVALVESAGPAPPLPMIAPFDVDVTVISQYAQSPTILAIVEAMASALDPRLNLETFYAFVWNVDTAQGFGLDIWGKIVDVSRLLSIPGTSDVFGFYTTDIPFDWQPWSQAPFAAGNSASSTYLLPDDAYRILILTKALANIAATAAPALNRLLQNLFPGRGVCYVTDNGGMSMSFVFEFPLTQIEFAILTQSGALPHPAGVTYNVVQP